MNDFSDFILILYLVFAALIFLWLIKRFTTMRSAEAAKDSEGKDDDFLSAWFLIFGVVALVLVLLYQPLSSWREHYKTEKSQNVAKEEVQEFLHSHHLSLHHSLDTLDKKITQSQYTVDVLQGLEAHHPLQQKLLNGISAQWEKFLGSLEEQQRKADFEVQLAYVQFKTKDQDTIGSQFNKKASALDAQIQKAIKSQTEYAKRIDRHLRDRFRILIKNVRTNFYRGKNAIPPLEPAMIEEVRAGLEGEGVDPKLIEKMSALENEYYLTFKKLKTLQDLELQYPDLEEPIEKMKEHWLKAQQGAYDDLSDIFLIGETLYVMQKLGYTKQGNRVIGEAWDYLERLLPVVLQQAIDRRNKIEKTYGTNFSIKR